MSPVPATVSKPIPTAGAKCAADIAALLRARNPLIWCVTREEARTERVLMDAAASAAYVPVYWDCAEGISGASRISNSNATDPAQALAAIRDSEDRQVWIMRDLHAWLRDPTVTRAVKSLCRELPQAARDNARAIIVVSPSRDIPPELAGHAIVVDIPLPDRAEIAQLLDAAISALPEDARAGAAANGARDASIDAALGLSAEEAQSTFARSLIVNSKRIDPVTVAGEKKRIIAREGTLEWIEPLAGGLDAVGGLANVKTWLHQRRAAFSQAARAYGLKPPKGILLTGVPGCGKSYTAKAIAAAWGLPLLRLDMGALKSKYVGDSEANIRKALKVAETVSPCVLWLDEIEKALAGATGQAADGGVSSDALGTILSWMQDRSGSVFVVATANELDKIADGAAGPLLRKGRFDEIFFVDLPTASERAAILAAALRENGRDPAMFGLAQLAAIAEASADFVGAEVASLVPDAMFGAFADGQREITASDLIAQARSIVPFARTAADSVTSIRKWAQGRCKPASAPEAAASFNAAAAIAGTRQLDV